MLGNLTKSLDTQNFENIVLLFLDDLVIIGGELMKSLLGFFKQNDQQNMLNT